MASKVSKADVLKRLEMRFDYQSARNVLNNWRKNAGVKDDDLDEGQVGALADYLEAEHEGSSDVASSLRRLGGGKDSAPSSDKKDDKSDKKDDKKDDKSDKKDDKSDKKDDKKDDNKSDKGRKDDKKKKK